MTMINILLVLHKGNKVDHVMQTKRKNIENNKSEGMLIFKFQLTCLFIKRKITND